MKKLVDRDGKELDARDKGLLLLLGICGDLDYLEVKLIKEWFMDSYADVCLNVGHPLTERMMDLRELVHNEVDRRRRRKKWRPM